MTIVITIITLLPWKTFIETPTGLNMDTMPQSLSVIVTFFILSTSGNKGLTTGFHRGREYPLLCSRPGVNTVHIPKELTVFLWSIGKANSVSQIMEFVFL